jgi:hypothetical protein
VGTEEGAVHSCSKAYGSDYLASWPAHSLAVYAVRWNPLHAPVFLSASADWSVKLWDSRAAAGAGPALSFDLAEAIGDAAWAPFSATVLSAVTDDGKVRRVVVRAPPGSTVCAGAAASAAGGSRRAAGGCSLFAAGQPPLLLPAAGPQLLRCH